MNEPRGTRGVGRSVASTFARLMSAQRKLVASSWQLVVRNRAAIAIASLIWLVWRSGTQPRRLGYPCQQAAAANLGFFAVLFIPGLAKLKARRARTVRQRAMILATGTVSLAGLLFILISGGVAVYSSIKGDTSVPPLMENATQGTGVPATVGIVRNPNWSSSDAELESMVREAVSLAGGLGPVMVDRRGGEPAPYDTPDGDIDVIIVPNMGTNQPGLVTNPKVTHTVVDMAWEAGADSVKLGGAATGDNWSYFSGMGYDSNGDHYLDHDPRVELIDLNDTGTTGACAAEIHYDNVTEIVLPTSGDGAAVIRNSYWVHNELLKTDVMIVVPCIKNHNLGTVTMGMKMRIGTAPQDIYFAPWLGCDDDPFLRWEMHKSAADSYTAKFPPNVGGMPASEQEAVQRSFVDLNLVRPHDFVVLDALIGCESGPWTYNEPSQRVHSIMASRDTVALDTIGALVVGYDPDQIPFLYMANNTNVLGVKDRDLITVAGDHVVDVRVPFQMWGSGYSASVPCETTAPAITGLVPAEGATVSGDVVITGSGISDNVGVIKAELYVDGVLVQTDTDDHSASFIWDATTVADGPHQLEVTVYDAMMNEASITRSVNVITPLCPPPTAACRNVTRTLSSEGTVTVTAAELNNGSTPGGDCAISDVEIQRTGGNYGDSVVLTCDDLGQIPIMLRVTQDDDQTDTCTATATVDDPSGTCLEPPTVESLTLSDMTLVARDTAEYTLTLKVSDPSGIDDIRGARAMINRQGTHAGQYRGYFTWGRTAAEATDPLGDVSVPTLQGVAIGSDLTCPGGDVIKSWSWESGSVDGWNLNTGDYCGDGQGDGDVPYAATNGGADGTTGHLYAPGKVAPAGCATGETAVANITLDTTGLDNLQARLWVNFHNQEDNGFEADDFYRILVDGTEILSIYGPRPGWNDVWEQHITGSFPASAENGTAQIEIRGRSSTPAERYGTDEFEIIYGGGACGGFWGFHESDYGGTTYVTPVSASTSAIGNQLTVDWTFRVKGQWAIDGPQTDNDVSGWSRDMNGNVQDWQNFDLDFAVTAVCAPPDLDDDCDVDGDDIDAFESCASGPAVPHSNTAMCRRADFDDDGDGDQEDAAVVQRCYSGDGNPPDPDCAN